MATEILRLDIDAEGLLSKQAEIKRRTDELRESMKSLDKSTEEGSRAFVDQEAQLRKLSGEYSSNRKALSQLADGQGEYQSGLALATKALDKQVNSIGQARENNKELLAVRNKININTDEGRAKIAKINERLDENNKIIKENVSGYEKQKISIGDYTGGIERAIPGVSQLMAVLTTMNGALTAQKAALQASTAGTSGLTKASKLLRIALISTGIGAIAVALGTLVGYLTTTQAGMDKLTAVTRPLQAVFQTLIGVVQTAGEALWNAVTRPKKAFEDLKGFIDRNIMPTLNALGKTLQGIATLNWGLLKEGISDAANAVGDVIEKTETAAKATRDMLAEAAAKGAEIDRITKEIERSEINMATFRAETNKQLKEQENIAKNRNLSEAERTAAVKEQERLAKALVERENEIVDLEIRRLEIKQSMNDTDRKDELELADLRAKRIENELKITEVERRNLGVINQLQNEIATDRNKAQAAAIKMGEDQLKANIEAMQIELEAYNLTNQSKLSSEDKLTDDLIKKEEEREAKLFEMKSAILEQEAVAQKFSDEKLNLERLKLETDYIAKRKEIQKAYQEQLSEEELAAKAKEAEEKALAIEADKQEFQDKLERMRLEGGQEMEIRLALLDKEHQEELKRAKELGVATTHLEEEYSKKKRQIAIAEARSKVAAYQAIIGNLAAFYENDKNLAQIASIAKAGMNIAEGITKAIASKGLAGVAEGVAIATAGAVQVAKIKKFEQGGVVEGPSHSQGGIPFTVQGVGGYEMEGGEYIVDKRTTSRFLPLLESLSGRKKSRDGKFFKYGGMVQANRGGGEIDYERLSQLTAASMADAVSRLPSPVVYVDDINSGQQTSVQVAETSRL